MYLTSFIKNIFFFIVTLLFLVGSPLSAAKPIKTDVAKEKKVPPGKVKSPIVEETSDNTAPVITLNGANPMDVTEGDTFIDPGATAADDTDGSVTVSATGSVDTSTIGTYTIIYTVTDSADNMATETRIVYVVAELDKTAPVITLNGSNPMDITQGDIFTDPGATAIDDTDGSVTVSATGSVNISTVGTYTIIYTVADSAGNSATEIRIVNVAAAPIVEETPICIAGDAALEGILKDNATGVVLANVEVSVGGCSTTTNEQGFYTLQNIAVNERAVVNFKKEGYLLGSTHIHIKTDSSNYLEYGIHAHDKQWNYDSTEGISGTHIVIDASSAYINTEGKPYSGIITANLTILDTITNEGKELFPGAFKGINTNGTMIQFDSYGLITIYLNDSNGNRLSLADGETATLGFDAVSSLEEQSTIPLWYYDYEQGLWFEEGYAELQPDGTYRGDISHLGTWSLNRPVENAPGTYRGRIVYEDGTPAKDVRIHAIGANWIGTDLSTNADGIFEIEVMPDSTFQLKAYNYKDKYEAVYDGTIQAIASGEIIEDRM